MRADAGFALLEVMIVIAVLSLGAFYKGVAGGVRTAGIAAHYEAALAHAQLRFAAMDGAVPG